MKWVTRETNKFCGSPEPDTTAANGDAQLAGNATPPIKSETQKSGHPIRMVAHGISSALVENTTR